MPLAIATSIPQATRMGAKGLYHAIVVMGVGTIGACGRTEENVASDGASTVTGSASAGAIGTASTTGEAPDDGVLDPADCEYRSQYHCDSYDPPLGCECDETLPRDGDDCGGSARLHCERAVCDPGEICLGADYLVDCSCVPDAPAGPEDCRGPGQFTCAFLAPEYRDCRCDEERPATPADCPEPEDYFCELVGAEAVSCFCDDLEASPEACQEQGCVYECQSYEPRFGCRCQCVTIR